MSDKHSYSMTYTVKSAPNRILSTSVTATSVSEARNVLKAQVARGGDIATVVACVKH
jgi:ABC-type Fe2+-enterobactin transport system substrate-binding protein